MTFPSDYPMSPPQLKFVTPMWHPEIYPDGQVCVLILYKADGYISDYHASEMWNPQVGVEAIFLSVISILNDPKIDSPANMDAAIQFRD